MFMKISLIWSKSHFFVKEKQNLWKIKNNILWKFQGTKTKGRNSIPDSAVNFRHKTCLICLQFSMRLLCWWGRERFRASSFVWNLKMGFVQPRSTFPLCFHWAATPFPSNCLGELVGHIQLAAVAGTSKVWRGDHTFCSLSHFPWFPRNMDHFQSGFLRFLGMNLWYGGIFIFFL